MPCTITQADLGKLAQGLTPEEADAYIEAATAIVLGPLESQALTEAAWRRCKVDPCLAIKYVAQHLIATDPKSGAGSKDVTSKSVGDVRVSYASTDTSGNFGDTSYGRLYTTLLSQFQLCRSKRSTMPNAYGGVGCR